MWVGECVVGGETGGGWSLCVELGHSVWGGRRNGEVERRPSSLLTIVDPVVQSSFHPLSLCLPGDVHLTLCFLYHTPSTGQLDLWLFRATWYSSSLSQCSVHSSGALMSAFGNHEYPPLLFPSESRCEVSRVWEVQTQSASSVLYLQFYLTSPLLLLLLLFFFRMGSRCGVPTGLELAVPSNLASNP